MKIKNLYEPVFNTHLLFIYDCTFLDAENYLNRKNIQTRLRACTGQTGNYIVTNKDKSTQSKYYLYIEKGKLKPEILAHEVLHLVFMSLHDAKIEITNKTDEVAAYYAEWWIKKINLVLA